MKNKPFFLTKSAFSVAMTCPTKLHYLATGYPSATEGDEYLQLLAEGGFIIGLLAQFLFPEGKTVPRGGDAAADYQQTKSLISERDCTLFEATLISGRCLARADILQREGQTLRLIEVKSKSFDSTDSKSCGSHPFRTKKGPVSSKWLPYLYDIAFQCVVLEKCFPEFTVEASLLIVDKSKRSRMDGLTRLFMIRREDGSNRPVVEFRGNTTEVLQGADILSFVPVTSEVAEIRADVERYMNLFEASLETEKPFPPRLSRACKECEFNGDGLNPSGYDECWRDIPRPKHHLFDLYFGTTLKVNGESLFESLLAERKASLFDVPLDALDGTHGKRQRIQIEYTRRNEEWISSELKSIIGGVRYPLQFIDFESTRTVLPPHADMRPFEQIAFQWSCHTIVAPGAEPVHTEWINTEDDFPNFRFARSLMENLKLEGTVFAWADHESSVLSDIRRQMLQFDFHDPDLLSFLELMVPGKGKKGPLVDMNRLTIEHYFHPDMKGRTSIKYVFPAIWRTNAVLRALPWFKEYEKNINGEILSPYDCLPALVIGGVPMVVKEGTAAMRAYESTLFGQIAENSHETEKLRQLLLQYCKLDTLAMVAIWEHWQDKTR